MTLHNSLTTRTLSIHECASNVLPLICTITYANPPIYLTTKQFLDFKTNSTWIATTDEERIGVSEGC